MEFALTFGAVGDFLSISLLIKDIVSALDDSRGSAKQYRDLVQGLANLRKTLQEVEQIYRDPKFLDGLDDLRTIALHTIEQIRQCLKGFRNQIRKYGPSLAEGGTGNVFKDVARKIQWKLEEKDTDKFRREVGGYTMSLKVLLEVATVRIVQRNHEASAKQLSDSENRTTIVIRESSRSLKEYLEILGRRILSKLDFVSRLGLDLKRSTCQILSMMSAVSGEVKIIRTVVMRLDRGVSDEHFVLQDATGRTFPIHLKTITSWEAFEYIINDRFKGKKGAHRIRRKRYSLQERATHQEVDRSTSWESAFLPYQRVDMSLMCREVRKGTDTRLLSSCPWCSTISPSETGVEVQCENCNMYFTRTVEMDDDEILPEASAAPHRIFDVRFGETSFKTATKRQRDDDASDNEEEDTCAKCQQPKRLKKQESQKRNRSREDLESDSDDEDIRGFVRITLVSKRRRTTESKLPFGAAHTESFDSVAQKILGKTSDYLVGDGTEDTGRMVFVEDAKFKPAGLLLRTNDESLRDLDDDEASDSGHHQDDKSESELEVTRPATMARFRPAGLHTAENTSSSKMSNDSTFSQTSTGSEIATVRPDRDKPPLPPVPKATDADARKHRIPHGYSLKNWDPTEEPILLLGSVFDANSLGKWIYDWTIYSDGPATPISDMAGELWLLLIKLAGRLKRAEEVVGRVRSEESRDMVEEFIEGGERLTEKLRTLLKACEAPILRKKKQAGWGKSVGSEFIENLFGRDRELARTEKFMQNVRLFELRFDANCEDILRNPTK